MGSSGSSDESLAGRFQALGLKYPSPCSRQGLPFCRVTPANCGLLPRSFHPYPLKRGGFVSVALSLGSPPVAVSDCHSLCCPDFPPSTLPATICNVVNCDKKGAGRPIDNLAYSIISPLLSKTKMCVERAVYGGIR